MLQEKENLICFKGQMHLKKHLHVNQSLNFY